MSQRYKLTVEYLGTAFRGFQAQPEVPTVQAELERALSRLVGSCNLSPVVISSRTDAGVHAMKNVCHVDLVRPSRMHSIPKVPHEPSVILKAINSFLREHNQPIVLCEVEAVPDTFHARYDALSREYVYQLLAPREISDRIPSTVFTSDRAWHLSIPLDVRAMAEASKYLIGKHDFTSFRAVRCQASSPVRHLTDLVIENVPQPRHALENGLELLHVKALAPSFLYHMVRNIVGTLVAVGHGKLEPIDVQRILLARNRGKAPPMAPAHGLYLRRVNY